MLAAHKRGLKPLGVLTYAPSWATGWYSNFFIHPAPLSADTFASFVQKAAQRYKGIIRDWEIWNEPNIQASFAPAPSPPLYSSMLIKSYTAIKNIDPYSSVIAGGTSPAADSVTTMAPATFIQGLYDNGAGNSFDAVAMHPYSVPRLLSADTAGSKTAISEVTRVLARNNQSYKKIWFTEFGAPTCGQYAVSETRQAQILVDGITYLRSLPSGGPIYLFDHRDIDSSSSNYEYCFGLRRTDFTAKQAVGAVGPYL